MQGEIERALSRVARELWLTSTSEPPGRFSVIAGGPIGEFHRTIELDADHFFFEDTKERMVVEIESFASGDGRAGPILGARRVKRPPGRDERDVRTPPG